MSSIIYVLNSTDRGSIVKAMFILKENNELHPYYGYIRFFFRICIMMVSKKKYGNVYFRLSNGCLLNHLS